MPNSTLEVWFNSRQPREESAHNRVPFVTGKPPSRTSSRSREPSVSRLPSSTLRSTHQTYPSGSSSRAPSVTRDRSSRAPSVTRERAPSVTREDSRSDARKRNSSMTRSQYLPHSRPTTPAQSRTLPSNPPTGSSEQRSRPTTPRRIPAPSSTSSIHTPTANTTPRRGRAPSVSRTSHGPVDAISSADPGMASPTRPLRAPIATPTPTSRLRPAARATRATPTGAVAATTTFGRTSAPATPATPATPTRASTARNTSTPPVSDRLLRVPVRYASLTAAQYRAQVLMAAKVNTATGSTPALPADVYTPRKAPRDAAQDSTVSSELSRSQTATGTSLDRSHIPPYLGDGSEYAFASTDGATEAARDAASAETLPAGAMGVYALLSPAHTRVLRPEDAVFAAPDTSSTNSLSSVDGANDAPTSNIGNLGSDGGVAAFADESLTEDAIDAVVNATNTADSSLHADAATSMHAAAEAQTTAPSQAQLSEVGANDTVDAVDDANNEEDLEDLEVAEYDAEIRRLEAELAAYTLRADSATDGEVHNAADDAEEAEEAFTPLPATPPLPVPALMAAEESVAPSVDYEAHSLATRLQRAGLVGAPPFSPAKLKGNTHNNSFAPLSATFVKTVDAGGRKRTVMWTPTPAPSAKDSLPHPHVVLAHLRHTTAMAHRMEIEERRERERAILRLKTELKQERAARNKLARDSRIKEARTLFHNQYAVQSKAERDACEQEYQALLKDQYDARHAHITEQLRQRREDREETLRRRAAVHEYRADVAKQMRELTEQEFRARALARAERAATRSRELLEARESAYRRIHEQVEMGRLLADEVDKAKHEWEYAQIEELRAHWYEQWSARMHGVEQTKMQYIKDMEKDLFARRERARKTHLARLRGVADSAPVDRTYNPYLEDMLFYSAPLEELDGFDFAHYEQVLAQERVQIAEELARSDAEEAAAAAALAKEKRLQAASARMVPVATPVSAAAAVSAGENVAVPVHTPLPDDYDAFMQALSGDLDSPTNATTNTNTNTTATATTTATTPKAEAEAEAVSVVKAVETATSANAAGAVASEAKVTLPADIVNPTDADAHANAPAAVAVAVAVGAAVAVMPPIAEDDDEEEVPAAISASVSATTVASSTPVTSPTSAVTVAPAAVTSAPDVASEQAPAPASTRTSAHPHAHTEAEAKADACSEAEVEPSVEVITPVAIAAAPVPTRVSPLPTLSVDVASDSDVTPLSSQCSSVRERERSYVDTPAAGGNDFDAFLSSLGDLGV